MIRTATGFSIKSKDAIDDRIVLTKEQMLKIDEDIYPDVYFCFCPDDTSLYIYNVDYPINVNTGKFRQVLKGKDFEFKNYEIASMYVAGDYIIHENGLYKATVDFMGINFEDDLKNLEVLLKVDLSDCIKTDDLVDYAKVSDIPTKVSQLDNDSEYVTKTELEDLDYADKTYVDEKIAGNTGASGTVDLTGYAKIDDIPTKVSVFENDSKYVTETQLEGLDYAKTSDIPTKVSAFENDSNYLTQIDTDSLYLEKTKSGDLTDLDTVNKGTLVDAINELSGLVGNSALDNYYTKPDTNLLLSKKADKVDVGDVDNLTVVGANDLVTAINKINQQFIKSMKYDDVTKMLVVDYKNGNVEHIDLSNIVNNLKIDDLLNVDTTGISDKQVLGYDVASNKYIPMSVDGTNVLDEAKEYTDNQIKTINSAKGLVVDSIPTYTDGTITYVESGVTKTTTDTNVWFYYKVDDVACQTIFINGIEFTIENTGSIDLSKYVKYDDVYNTYTGTEIDLTKVVSIGSLKALQGIINGLLGNKVNTVDIVDDLNHTDIDKPLSSNQGNRLYKMINDISVTVSGSGSVILKRVFENVSSGVKYDFHSPVTIDDGALINVYKVEDGGKSLTKTLQTFTSGQNNDFGKDNIIINNDGAHIVTNCGTISSQLNGSYYESEVISKSNYAELFRIEVK